jgi:hypothetical protein
MKKMMFALLFFASCAHPNKKAKRIGDDVTKKVVEIDSVSYWQMDEKIAQLDYFDTTNQTSVSNTELIDAYCAFLSKEVNDYTTYKRFFNEMSSSRDTIFILQKGRNFYRYLKNDSKTNLVFDAYMKNTRSLPEKLRQQILKLTVDKSKPLVMSDSTFTRSMMIHFKGDTIHKLIFVCYLD